ncbi:MAG TPA: hypothetical protein VM681_09110 [Candidatus Thermoplasmatota archaeon]|nr:hypothetical protein [Candidatus Thermoplasmatota archaeon]
MVVPGLCVVCSRPATTSCRLCGSIVCQAHAVGPAGGCARCLGSRI